MSGSRQQLYKIPVSDIQLMSLHGSVFSTIVSAHQSVGKCIRGPGGANTPSPNVVLVRHSPWCRKLGTDAGRYRNRSP